MKELYTSPVITVEDLAKADVLCASNPVDAGGGKVVFLNGLDNVVSTISNLSDFM
jgi:hypothetical protein